ncbi:hypothetical protein [Streptomyces broussonetiae]|uniref:Uncharacterized protein n=1 Tax=Streptomyces broussonetiae TaxID=2686304 RepID=A0A6I6NCM4_9ACTN|nr:hypothetical protein [Streptomyces broussonetiae]QHA09144.1 hypothetical protein GQF42_43395 [Streptomyces broussonetiae]
MSLPLFPPLPDTGTLDRTVSAHWPEPALVFDAAGDTGLLLAHSLRLNSELERR